MDWDDKYDNGYSDMGNASHRDNSISDNGSSDGGPDFTDIANPVNAYFFLSDDAQDEITGSGKTRMKCLSCGHIFRVRSMTVARSALVLTPRKRLMKIMLDLGESH